VCLIHNAGADIRTGVIAFFCDAEGSATQYIVINDEQGYKILCPNLL
jgi:hypothetical protein